MRIVPVMCATVDGSGALTVVVPVIVLFLAAQRYFVNGLMGAVKA